jgi:hypothetical protein
LHEDARDAQGLRIEDALGAVAGGPEVHEGVGELGEEGEDRLEKGQREEHRQERDQRAFNIGAPPGGA